MLLTVMHSGAPTHHRCRLGVELTQVWNLAFGRVSTLSISPGCLQNSSPLLPLPAQGPLTWCDEALLYYMYFLTLSHVLASTYEKHRVTQLTPGLVLQCPSFASASEGRHLTGSYWFLLSWLASPVFATWRMQLTPSCTSFLHLPQVGYCQLLSPPS